MKKLDLSKPLEGITFRCEPCEISFKSPPARVDAAPEAEHHPFTYAAPCPACKAECGQVGWERALLKAWVHATGPVTPEGKAATAANLEGHPTAEEALRTRFNAMKHGLNARTAQYFPSKPDGYSFCKGCTVDRAECAAAPCCIKQTQLFMLTHAAFDQRDPSKLKGVYADFQASVFALLQLIITTIIGDGVALRSPKYYTSPTKEGTEMVLCTYLDKDGVEHTLYDVHAHPLFKPLGELLSRNNLSLADMGMTTKVIDIEQEELGRIESQEKSRTLIGDFLRQQQDGMRGLQRMIELAAADRERDPILVEYQKQNDQ